MTTFVSQGDGKFRLEDGAGREVGWIRGRSIGIRGFATEADAVGAATRLRSAVHGALERFGMPLMPHELALGELRLVHDGAYEWVADGNFPVARLHRPGAARRADSFGLEFVVPTGTGERATIAVARALLEAVEREPASETPGCGARHFGAAWAAPGFSEGEVDIGGVVE